MRGSSEKGVQECAEGSCGQRPCDGGEKVSLLAFDQRVQKRIDGGLDSWLQVPHGGGSETPADDAPALGMLGWIDMEQGVVEGFDQRLSDPHTGQGLFGGRDAKTRILANLLRGVEAQSDGPDHGAIENRVSSLRFGQGGVGVLPEGIVSERVELREVSESSRRGHHHGSSKEALGSLLAWGRIGFGALWMALTVESLQETLQYPPGGGRLLPPHGFLKAIRLQAVSFSCRDLPA